MNILTESYPRIPGLFFITQYQKVTNTKLIILLNKTRRYSEELRQVATLIYNQPELKRRVSKTFIRITHTHALIWNITGQISTSHKRWIKSRDVFVLHPGNTSHTQDCFDLIMPSWTEIMAHTSCEIPERSKLQCKKKFNTQELRKLLKYDNSGKCINAFQVITSIDILKVAYDTIKSKPGNMVRGSDPRTFDGLPIKWFEQTSERLKDGTYQFNPARRVMIPKPNGKMRPLGISSPALPPPPHRQVKGVRGERNALSG